MFIVGTPTRIGLFVYFAVVVALGVYGAHRMWLREKEIEGRQLGEGEKGEKPAKTHGDVLSSKSLNLRRKYYHAMAVMMFIPGYLVEPSLMHLSLSFALSFLLLLELIRHFRVYPFGTQIDVFVREFLDEKDRKGGDLVVSHLYLLIGCGVGVWLDRLGKPVQANLTGLMGTLALGVGDSMASVVGYAFGRIRWPVIDGTEEDNLRLADLAEQNPCSHSESENGYSEDGSATIEQRKPEKMDMKRRIRPVQESKPEGVKEGGEEKKRKKKGKTVEGTLAFVASVWGCWIACVWIADWWMAWNVGGVAAKVRNL
ncbi:hypothetical protein HK102_009561 [Quaeritorhiza haematococci]|nr:hypothetical protein HK102_009561 [Quaeritorhiza haematococci]